jgi:hypothetical protein
MRATGFGGNYRLIIKVTKGDNRGQIIEAIARGRCVGFDDIKEAIEGQMEFHRIVDMIPRPDRDNEFGAYGMSIIQDEKTGILDNPRPI